MANSIDTHTRSALRKGGKRLANRAQETVAVLPMAACLMVCGVTYSLFPNFAIAALMVGAVLYVGVMGMLLARAMVRDPEAAITILILATVALVFVTCLAVLAFLFYPTVFSR